MSTASTPTMLPTTKRPVPLRARDDLVAERIEYRGEGSWVLKDPVGLKYHRLLDEQHRILRALDGQRNLEEICEKVRQDFPALNLTLYDIQSLVTDLHRKGLVYSDRPGQGPSLIERNRENRQRKFFTALRSLLYVRLPGWDPERTLQWLYPFVRWMFRRWAVVAAIVLVVSSWMLLAVQFEHFRRMLPAFQQFFCWPNLIYLWLALGVAKVIHEFGHGLSCKHFGGECHEMGLMLLVFSPCLYCDVTDSWMLHDKWRRILIAAAGMYIEIIISALAIFVWWNTRSGLLHHLCLNVFFVTTITTVIFNANPLMRFDGYYIMSDWLEIPNLRPKADKMLRDKFAWHCLGIESQPDPFLPESGRTWFALYAVAAAVYRWVILFGITLFLYTVLKPYRLQSIGMTLAVVSIGGIFVSMSMNVYKIIATPRAEPMSYRRLTVSLSIFLLVLVACLTIPLPLHIESAFLIEPHRGQHVFTSTPGMLVGVYVQPEQRVKQGQLLANLENSEKQDAYEALQVKRDVEKKRILLFHELEDEAQKLLAQEALAGIEEELKDFEQQLKHLTILAPCDGIVIAPPDVSETVREAAGDPLNVWSSTPLKPRNIGCYLESRTHLLSIAPSRRFQAVALVDQADRNDMNPDQELELKFEHLSDRTYKAKITEISERHLEFAPDALSNKQGGELSTVTDLNGRERLVSSAYQAIVVLQEDTELFRSGMRGRARFVVEQRSAAQWLWRYLTRIFHFRL